jgi:H+/gluconate symporter-like permease
MSIIPLMWAIWAGLTTTLLVLLLYRSNLTRYEEDQIFLEESSERQNKDQQELLKKVNRVTPLVKIVTVCTCAMTAAILGFYVWDAVKQFYM